MLSFTRRRLIVLSVFIALAIFAGFKFGPGSRAAKPKSLPMLGGPTIAATMTAAPTTDIGGNGAFVNPGDTLEYTVSINNTGQQANGVVFTDNLTDANLTLVPGSVKASPIAFDDTYPVTGNVRIQKAAGTLVSNDIRPTTGDNTGLTISAIGSDNTAPFSFTTANGGTVTATTGNGSFEYNPPPGFEGTAGSADTFTYTVTDPDGLTGTGTVRLDVSGMIWFINNGAPACTTLAAGCGRLTDPFSNLPAFTTINDGIGNNPAVNDNIFIFTGIGNYAAALTLLDGQKYIGQGASASIASITGLTLAADSDALPTTTPGANAVMIAGSGTSITLGVGNTIRGITVDNVGTGTKIFGSGFGTLTIGNNTTPDVTLSGTGKALDLTNGTFAATSAFSSVTTTSSPSHGMQLITVGGTVAFGSTSVSGSTAQGIFVNNSGVNLNFGNTTVGATGGATECIRLETNTGGTRTFGTIGVTNCTAQGITISGGGNVVATGQTTITNPGSTGLLLSSTTAGTSATFAGVNSTQSGGTGVQVSSSAGTVSFGDLDISPDSGQRALLADQNTGTISSTSGTIVATGNAGPFAISGPAGRTPLAMTLDSVNLTAPTNVGVNIALVSGNLTIGTTTIAGGAGNLVGLQVLSTAAGGTMNFGNTAVTGTNSVAGVRLGLAGQGNAGGVTFADLDIAPDSGHPALLITDGSGTTTSTSGAITATAAQAVNSSSSVLAMVLDSVTSTGGGITPGVNLTSSSGSIVMNGGTLTGNASGRTFLINSGTISSTYRGGITQAANSEMIEITGGHGTGTVTFNTGTLSATNGRGLLFDNADGLYNFNGITTLNGGDAGIDIINGSAGSLTFNGSTSITNPTGIAFRQDASNASVNYSGTITKTNNANHAVDINGKTGGATAFIGAITATTTTANAIDLTNTGGSTTFSGGMNINTTTGIGFNSTGAGQTVSVCDENPCNPAATGAAANTLTSVGTGTALNVVDTTIGANNLEFRSISVNGATKGIVLNSTGTAAGNGGLTVTGTGTTVGSGGTIQNTSNRGGEFITTKALVLKNMNFTNAGTTDLAADNSGLSTGLNLTTNAAIHLQSVTGANIDNVDITCSVAGCGEQGINGNTVSDFHFDNGSIVNVGNGPDEDNIHFFNMSGTSTITNSVLTHTAGGGDDNLNLQTQAGTLNLTISGGSCNGAAGGALQQGSGYLFGIRGTTNATLTLSTVNSNNNFSGGIVADSFDNANMAISVTNSTSSNNNDQLSVSAGDTSDVDLVATGNTMASTSITPGSADFVVISLLGSAFDTGFTFDSRIQNNNITVANGVTADGIAVFNAGGGAMNLLITGNSLAYGGTQRAINLQTGQDGAGAVNVTATGNTIDVQLDGAGNAVNGILAQSGVADPSGAGSSICADLGGAGALANIFTHSLGGTLAGGDIRVRQRFNNNVRLPGYGGGTTDTTAVATYLDGRNTEVSASTASHGGGTGTFTGGAACTQPSPLANFDETASAGSKVSNWNNDLTTSQIDVAMASIEINPTDVDWGSNGAVMASANIDIAPTKIETPSANVEWASANIEIEPTAVETTTAAVDNGPSTFGAIASLVDKMTSQISPTVYSQETTKQVPEAGLVTVNGSGSGFTLPTNKSTTITFRAVITNPTTPVNTFSVSNQGSVSATGFGPVLTDDPGVAGVANPTVTTVVQPPTIAKTFTPANILLDQQSTLTITINNTNPAQAVTGITVTDVFPTNVVVATPLVASTTCGAGTLQDSDGNTLAPGDVGIKLITGTRAAAQSCTVTVKVRGTSGGTYVNTTGNVASFEGFVGTTASSTLNVSVLTATELSISGRVTSSEGRGIRNARVVITGNSLAQPINVFTGVNGTYQVNGLAAGETYIVTVMSRRFAFESPSRVVTLIDNVTDADFIGLLGTDRQQ